MAYARKRGNQIAIVQGERDPATGRVEQRILFTLYSKAEARAALGKRGSEGSQWFRAALEGRYPSIRFDWAKIERGIRAELAVLPDEYSYREERLLGRFRDDLLALFRQLVLADAGTLTSAFELVDRHRLELGVVRDLIDQRLEARAPGEQEWMQDDRFYWRFAMLGDAPTGQVEETFDALYERGELERAEAGFRLLVDCFEGYAEGHNYLGVIGMDRGRLDAAVEHFQEAARIGRKRFPRRKSGQRWSDLHERSYVRALRNLALALERSARHEEALEVCDRLERECADEPTASSHRAAISLNTGRWRDAVDCAIRAADAWPSESFVAAFGLLELGDRGGGATRFLHGALNHPRCARMLVGLDSERLGDQEDLEDYETGLELQDSLETYLHKPRRKVQRLLRSMLELPQVDAMLDEVKHVRTRRGRQRAKGIREAFDRRAEMTTFEYAEERAREVLPLLEKRR